MADGSQHLLIFQKINGQSYLFSTLSPNLQSRNTSVHSFSGNGLALVSPLSPIFAQVPTEKGTKVSAAVSKSATTLIERVKLLIQNQDEIIKAGRLSELYKGITDCFAKTIKDEDALNFTFKDYFKRLFNLMATGSGLLGTWHQVVLLVLRLFYIFVYSLNFARTRLANDTKACVIFFFFFFSFLHLLIRKI
ncbi:hypothetical protein PVL29_012297 [Vitis rotundifolia]|uniref:ADP/ATP translocase n=1 Tax=Vitis rotundifolia TaxID=103349 RepID=A0AA38ZRL0_VITRO|nr:hypothetical protein PVL29_012297 [Vitis rotundifolia]